MMRIGFQINFRDKGWMGGINYFRNLFEAIKYSDIKDIDPLVVAGYSADKGILASLGVDNVTLSLWGDTTGWRWMLRRALALGFGRDFIFEKELLNKNVDLISHLGYLGKNSKIPSLVWIPDFQERYLPDFFSAAERNNRDRENRNIVKHASAILLSSEHAREGLAQISKYAAKRAYVLPFVATVPRLSELPSIQSLVAKYDLPESFFFLPNQFWKHKNHEVVIRALALLKNRGKPVTVISTGNPQDHRQPKFFRYLTKLIIEENVIDDFRILGVLPFIDLMGLMSHSIAIINPSLFEGWSTTVEEAKSLGKIAIISDIPVHREQAPSRGIYFNAYDAYGLADILFNTKLTHSKSEELAHMKEAELSFPARRLAFAERYKAILCNMTNHQYES